MEKSCYIKNQTYSYLTNSNYGDKKAKKAQICAMKNITNI